MTKQVAITDFLTAAEIERAAKLYREAAPGTFAARCEAEIIAPILPRIELTMVQPMNARYVAYMVEYVLTASEAKS